MAEFWVSTGVIWPDMLLVEALVWDYGLPEMTLRFGDIYVHILTQLHRLSISSFYRATACNATNGIAVAILSICLSVRLSVCPSVCPSDACIVTKLNNALRIF